MFALPFPRALARRFAAGLCLLGWLLALPLAAQVPQTAPLRGLPAEAGQVFLKTFRAQDYGAYPQNWAVLQDRRGLLYVANSAGVLEYDGSTWRLIPTANASGARSLAMDAAGNIFVGAVNDFGVLRPTSASGRMEYVSLAGLVPAPDRDFGDVWKCYATKEGVFFQTFTHVFRFRSSDQNPVRVWRPRTKFDIGFAVYDRFFVRQEGLGLSEIVGDSLLLPAQFGPAFANLRVFSMMPFPGDTVRKPILIVTREAGLFRLEDGVALRPVPFAAAQWLVENQVYHAQALSTTRIAFATKLSGVLVTDRDGVPQYHLDTQHGLPDDQSYFVYPDAQGGVWVALNNGLARAEMPSPLTRFDERNGLRGTVTAVVRHDGSLYAATNLGVYRLVSDWPTARFVPTGILASTRDLLSVPQGVMVATESDGIFLLPNRFGRATAAQRIGFYRAKRLLRSRLDSTRVYVGLSAGLAAMRYTVGRWREDGIIPNVIGDVTSLAEGADGSVWVMTSDNQLTRVIPRRGEAGGTRYDVQDYGNQPDRSAGANAYQRVFAALGHVWASTLDSLYQLDEATQRFVPATGFLATLSDTVAVESLTPYRTAGDLVLTDQRGGLYFGFRQTGGRYKLFPVPALRRSDANTAATQYVEQGGAYAGIIWQGGYDGLLRFDPDVPRKYDGAFAALIRRVRLLSTEADSTLFHGTFFDNDTGRVSATQTEAEQPLLDYGFGTIRFEVAAANFEVNEATEYQFLLKGLDERWSEWQRLPSKEYSNLREGTYTLRVRARNVYGQVSSEASFTFAVDVPWYRTWYAVLGLVLVVLGLVYLYTRWRVESLHRENRQLEERVEARTRELTEQTEALELANQEISRQHDSLVNAYEEIELKNRDITDSIQYARRIQEALLPVHDELRRVLPEAFVLNRPRDIVSGDFYWVTRQMDAYGHPVLILAVVDCTGHGVPGALMSIMGSTLFNQIVNENRLTDPAAILGEMDRRVRTLLRQDVANTVPAAQDGMDVALLAIHPQAHSIRFAGACRPLFFWHQGELQEVPGRKHGIGGRLVEPEPFETHTLSYAPGDMAYLATDGYADQFGGPNRRKFMVGRFKELLASIAQRPHPEQAVHLETALADWRGPLDQVDDILVVGVRLS